MTADQAVAIYLQPQTTEEREICRALAQESAEEAKRILASIKA